MVIKSVGQMSHCISHQEAEINAGARFSFSRVVSLGLQLMEWYYPHPASLLSLVRLSGNSFIIPW